MDQPTRWILDDLPMGVWVGVAPEGRVAYANRAFAEIMGMDVVGDSLIADVPATYGVFDRTGRPFPMERLPFSQALATGWRVVVDDIVIHRRDGRRVNIRASGHPVRDAAGNVTHVIVAFLDITREVVSELERQTIEARLKLAADHAPIIIWAIDAQGTITVSEGAGLAALGFRSGELVGRSAFELYKDNPALLGNMRRALAGESFWVVDQVGDAYLNTWMAPLRDAGGTTVGVIGLTNDVSELRRLQAGMMQADRLSAIGTLAASVAHEINNPLTYVLGGLAGVERSLERLRDLGEGAPPQALRATVARLLEDLKPVRKGVERIATVTRDLKTFSRPDDTRLEPVDVRGVVEVVLKLARKDVEARARLRLALGDVPPVRGNEARLVQVVMNLLMNAAHALADGDPQRDEVSITTRAEGHEVVLEVGDTGPGVSAADRERIFEPFVTTKPIGEGTGLGLFVCRNVVRGLGGEVSVRERPGGGALFQVRLPASPEVPAARPAAPLGAASGRVLVIDDDLLVARTLVSDLADAGFEAVAITDPARALAVLTGDETFDLAYCDLMMGGLTGMDLAAALQARVPERLGRVVFMTGGAFAPRAAAFVAENAGRCVEKPFDVVRETRRRLGGA